MSKNLLKYLTIILVISMGCKNETKEENQEFITGNPSIDAISSAINKTPDDPNLYFQRAILLYENEGYDQAILDLQKSIQLEPNSIENRHLLADVYLDYYKSEQALKTLEELHQEYPNTQTALKLSEFYFILKQHEKALVVLEELIKNKPQEAEAHFMKGLVLKEQNLEKEAFNSFQSALELDADIPDLWLELATLSQKVKPELVQTYFNSALTKDSLNQNVLLAYGNYLGGEGNFSKAIEIFKSIVRLNPQNHDAFYNLGLIYKLSNKLDEAIKNLTIAINIEPDLINAYFLRAECYLDQKKVNLAKFDLETMLKLDPENEKARIQLQKI